MSTTPRRAKRCPKVRSVSKRKVPLPPQLQRMNLNAAGIDTSDRKSTGRPSPRAGILKGRMCAGSGLSPETWAFWPTG